MDGMKRGGSRQTYDRVSDWRIEAEGKQIEASAVRGKETNCDKRGARE